MLSICRKLVAARLTCGTALRAAGGPLGGCRRASTDPRGVTAAIADCFQQCVSPDVAANLRHQGFAVLDGVFGSDMCEQLKNEISALRASTLMNVNATHLVKEGATQRLEKRNIWEAEALTTAVQEAAPTFGAMQNDLTLMTMLNVYMPELQLTMQALKLQFNQGGCFPVHHDSDALLDGRVITVIFYLNPDWSPSDGGELRLYPFPLADPIDIPPINDRAVLFSSTQMPHRVLPTSPQFQRFCFTCWTSTHPRQRLQPSCRLSKAVADPREAAEFLLQPQVKKHLVKLVYNEEWVDSLRESHPPGEALDRAVSQHQEEVAKIGDLLRPHICSLLQQPQDAPMTSLDLQAIGPALRGHGSEALVWL